MVAVGKAAGLGVPAGDTSKFLLGSVIEFRTPAFDAAGRSLPADDEAYWAITLLFADPARTIENDVFIGTRKARMHRAEPMDTVSYSRKP